MVGSFVRNAGHVYNGLQPYDLFGLQVSILLYLWCKYDLWEPRGLEGILDETAPNVNLID